MSETPKPVESNADRNLERHTDPSNPGGPLLSHCPSRPQPHTVEKNRPNTRSKRPRVQSQPLPKKKKD